MNCYNSAIHLDTTDSIDIKSNIIKNNNNEYYNSSGEYQKIEANAAITLSGLNTNQGKYYSSISDNTIANNGAGSSLLPINSLGLANDNLISCRGEKESEDNINRIDSWNINSNTVNIDGFEGHTKSINSIYINENQKTFITGSSDKSVIKWDIKNRNKIEQYTSDNLDKVCSVIETYNNRSDHKLINDVECKLDENNVNKKIKNISIENIDIVSSNRNECLIGIEKVYYFVKKDSTNSGDGLTPDNPSQNINNILTKINDETINSNKLYIIYVFNGTYSESCELPVDKNIYFIGEDNEKTIINSSGPDKDCFHQIKESTGRYKWKNLKITSSKNAINLDKCIAIYLENCIINNNTTGIYLLNTSGHNTITNCDISYNTEEGIYLKNLLNQTLLNAI